MKLSDEEIGKLSATCDGPGWSYDLVRKVEALLLSKIAAERDAALARDDVLRLARAAGFRSAVMLDRLGTEAALCDFEVEELARLERFATLVAATEREACIEDVRTVGGKFSVECEALMRKRWSQQ